MLNLEPITSGLRNGRHAHYPTPGLAPYEARDDLEAEETACSVLMKYHSVSFLRLVDEAGTELRTYRRSDFFQSKSPLRKVHHRLVDRRVDAIRDESTKAQQMADAGK